MDVKLDWQQDLEEEGWPQQPDGPQPPQHNKVRLRWALLIGLALIAVSALVVWRLSERGEAAAKADVQEAVTFAHWAAQRDDPNLFRRSLDPIQPLWQSHLLQDWEALAAAAQDAPAPVVETVALAGGDLAEVLVRWSDATGGQQPHSYLAQRWYRRVGDDWRWTVPQRRPPDQALSQQTTHLSLTYHTSDGEIAAPLLDVLDRYTADLCQRYSVRAEDCFWHLRWDVLDQQGAPLALADLPLPVLAAITSDVHDDPVYVAGLRFDESSSRPVRQRLLRLFPGRDYAGHAHWAVLRPSGLTALPNSQPGDADQPIFLPSPWLTGVDDSGQPHPAWLAHAQRVLNDAVLRRAEGHVLGSAQYVNSVWALHQALLALEQGLPALARLAEPGAAAAGEFAPLALPDLASLGAALQAAPDELALAQLGDLARYLVARYERPALNDLPQAIGQHATVDRLLLEALGSSETDFLAGWRKEQLAQPDSPLAGLAEQLQEHMRAEAVARQPYDWVALLRFYTPAGGSWISTRGTGAPFVEEVGYDPSWAVSLRRMGAIGDVVWVELEERNSQHGQVDLRFYRWSGESGWLRDAPHPDFWGRPRELQTGLVHWLYHESDEAAVAVLAASVDGYAAQLFADLGLAPEAITITVAADTAINWGQVGVSPHLHVPSPRNYMLHLTGDSAVEALRQNVALVLASRQVMRKVTSFGAPDTGATSSASWPQVMGVLHYEFDQMGVASFVVFDQLYAAVAQALVAGQLPNLGELLAGDLNNLSEVQAGYVVWAARYVLEEHGVGWIDPLFNTGIATVLQAIAAEKGWSWQELEADVQRFLLEKQ